jgi:ribosomal-protein-alanine N-acetyltransferase
MLMSPKEIICIHTKQFTIRSIEEYQITEKYLGWLNDPELNLFLEAKKAKQSLMSICDYINSLRNLDDCDLLAITINNTKIHIGNVTFTQKPNLSTGIYGILIGDRTSPQSLIAGSICTIAIIDFLFDVKNVDNLIESVKPKNKKASGLLIKLGFKLKKRSPEFHSYGLTKSDWANNRYKYESIVPYNSNFFCEYCSS